MTLTAQQDAPALRAGPRVAPEAALIYRSTDRGQTWELLRQFDETESFATNGVTDSYQMVSSVPGDAQHVVLLGHAASDAQQQVWMSADAGVTWVLNPNAADPFEVHGDDYSEWLVYGPGGVLALASHGIRVGTAIPSPQGSIVG